MTKEMVMMQREEMESDLRGCSFIGQRQCLSTVTGEKAKWTFTDICSFCSELTGGSFHLNLYPLNPLLLLCVWSDIRQ